MNFLCLPSNIVVINIEDYITEMAENATVLKCDYTLRNSTPITDLGCCMTKTAFHIRLCHIKQH